MITKIVIISVTLGLAIFDIIMAVRKKRTLTKVMREWYKDLPIVAYIVALLFIGHMGMPLLYKLPGTFGLRITFFILLNILVMTWAIIQEVKEDRGKPIGKFYKLCCNVFLIPMTLGTLVGWLWF